MRWKDIKNIINKELKEANISADIKKIPKELDKASKMHADQSKSLAKSSKAHKNKAKRLIKDLDSVDLNKTSLEDILKGEFFKSLDTGINNGSAERLQNCFYTCGVK